MSGPIATYGRPGASQKVAYTAAAGTIANPISDHIFLVRVVLTTDGYIAIGKAPVATTNDMFMPANTPEYFKINAGEKVSAVQDSASGILHVTEITN